MRFFNRHSSPTDSPVIPPDLSKDQIKRATRTREIFTLLTSFFLFLTVLFLLLLEIGGSHNRPVIRDWHFMKLDLSHIIPTSVPNFALINTIAQTLGLHDFYTVGLWGFCEGYKADGVTYCSPTQSLYWFNPVEILRNELLAGASIALPADINDILDLIRLASRVMFGFFLTSACLSFVLMFLNPLSVRTRWWTFALSILNFVNALFCTVASVIATVMFIIFRNTISGVAELNIGASIGDTMFAFMWIASAFAIFAWLFQMGMCCCCASRRDVRTGRKRGNEHAYQMNGGNDGAANGESLPMQETSGRRRFPFGKRSV